MPNPILKALKRKSDAKRVPPTHDAHKDMPPKGEMMGKKTDEAHGDSQDKPMTKNAMHRLPPGAKEAKCQECGAQMGMRDSKIVAGQRMGQCPKCGAMHVSPKRGGDK